MVEKHHPIQSALTKEEILPFVEMLVNSILSQIHQRQRDKYHTFSPAREIYRQLMTRGRGYNCGYQMLEEERRWTNDEQGHRGLRVAGGIHSYTAVF